MAGSRTHKYKSIFKRAQGLMKSNALEWRNRPLWYDVMERFPPKVNPYFERPVPTQTVTTLLYPEDLIRAKYYQEFGDRDIANLILKVERHDVRLKSQIFVETYKKHQKPGMTVDEIVAAAEEEMNKDSRTRLIRRKVWESPKPDPLVSDFQEGDSEKPTHYHSRRLRVSVKGS